MKNFLDSKIHFLIRGSNPVEGKELLGPNLQQKIQESSRISEAAGKIYHTKRGWKNNFPWYRERGRNYFSPPQTNQF